MTDQRVTVELLPSIASVARDDWQQALSRGDSNIVFLTREWQQAWWDAYGRGKLLLLAARRNKEIVAIAPLFTEKRMIYFVGSGGSDCLDFIGDISNPETLDALLTAAREQVDDFIGFRFYFVPDRSHTGELLNKAGERLALEFCDAGQTPAPILDLLMPNAVEAAVTKKTVGQHERFFERTGGLGLREMHSGDDIAPYLDEFFAQHVGRWQSTPSPSLFLEEMHRQFYRGLVREASAAGWLRFTRLEYQDRAIASHFGFCYNGNYSYYKPAFSVDLARHSPGQVLLRRLILAAIDEHASTFDFGIGDEPYKQRFATATPVMKTWGLFAPGRRRDDPGR